MVPPLGQGQGLPDSCPILTRPGTGPGTQQVPKQNVLRESGSRQMTVENQEGMARPPESDWEMLRDSAGSFNFGLLPPEVN